MVCVERGGGGGGVGSPPFAITAFGRLGESEGGAAQDADGAGALINADGLHP